MRLTTEIRRLLEHRDLGDMWLSPSGVIFELECGCTHAGAVYSGDIPLGVDDPEEWAKEHRIDTSNDDTWGAEVAVKLGWCRVKFVRNLDALYVVSDSFSTGQRKTLKSLQDEHSIPVLRDTRFGARALFEGDGEAGVDIPMIKRVKINRGARSPSVWYIETTPDKSDDWVINRAAAAYLKDIQQPPTAKSIARVREQHNICPQCVTDVSDTYRPGTGRLVGLSAGLAESEVTVESVDQIDAELSRIEEEIPELDLQANVRVHKRMPGANHIFIHGIRVLKTAPPGTGTRGLERVIEIADRHHLPICLSIAPREPVDRHSRFKQTSSRSRLIKWYRSHGFRPKAVIGRYDLSGEFVRLPRQ